MSYKPFIYKLQSIKSDDIYSDNSVITSTNISQPLFSLGFHFFIHRTKSAMSITNKLETKNKFYYVVNPFEHSINDYDKDIAHTSDLFLNKPEILSRAFYKMWEMLYMFDIASKDKMIMVGIAEGPGSFIQSFVEFREKYFNPENDKVYGLTINTDNSVNINRTMMDNINKRYDNMINVIKTTKKKIADSNTNGDITKVSTLAFMKTHIKQKADLVTADGGFEWKNENYQEQEAYVLILGEILGAINIQAKDGNFILKVFETFTHTTIKLIYLLTTFYNDVYIYKPFFSRATNSEKYIICKGFKYEPNDNTLNKHIKILEETLKNCNTDKFFISDIFPKFKLTEEHLNIFKYININIANVQQIMINNLVVYIKSNNYFGDMYHTYREQQITANKWWIDNFFTEKLIERETLVKDTIKYNESELNLFVKKFN